MKLITIAGPPSSGKTSVTVKACTELLKEGFHIGMIKLDCVSTQDHEIYESRGFLAKEGLSGNLCPDHYFACNIQECVDWGIENNLDLLVTESAGLCNRCSPHIDEVMAVCVIDNLMGVNAPVKIGPMLKTADLIIITKGEIVSQAEREIFALKVRQCNPKATILHVNGITGQGSREMADFLKNSETVFSLETSSLRFTMPAALCSYCLGEKKIGSGYQKGNVRKIDL
ncbi:GTP-binding protein [Tindallia californiensis]|uniref:Ni2+-binding GTPase involved in regulation of expression and maturation of urease and hydrogenase n=1 Tax=Tindallia californiensis TaxID=159292 RepID=A0A1H3MCW7_9FIRM|nr:GTP-binding protein [Tindallia californiensis]SDY74436.1 Ni2+-binding GTPase involved in regulation of expression and maturation of urease and hydrogenase [Tindallia californiensis]